jgi:transcription elongation GreA/GreB family factor
LGLIEQKLKDLHSDLAAAQGRGDKTAISMTSRELRYWSSRRTTANVIPLPTDVSAVRFGSIVTIERADAARSAYQVVGEDEAEPANGSLSHASLLARALLGKAVSVGKGDVEIVDICALATPTDK